MAALRKDDRLTPDMVYRDPYFLNFLRPQEAYSEKDLEGAILREREKFILEPGEGFAFVDRQKRTIIDGDYYLDLLFYHRKLPAYPRTPSRLSLPDESGGDGAVSG